MLRSFVCSDIKEDEDSVESKDETQSCFDSKWQEHRDGHDEAGLSASTELVKANVTKVFLENANEKLRYLKSLKDTSRQNKPKVKYKRKVAHLSRRKKKVDIGEPVVITAQKSLSSKTVANTKEQAIKGINNDDEKGTLSISEMVTKLSKRKDGQLTNAVVLGHLSEQDFRVHEVYDPHGVKKSRIEKDLSEAIEQRDFELAQKISDEISERQLSERIANNFNACSHLEKQRIEKEAMDKRKKKLSWMFDHKERWELKGNM